MGNYNMCELSASLYDFVVIFNLDKKLPLPMNMRAVLNMNYKKGNRIKHLHVKRAEKQF